jgi:histidine ammonia-lyase
MAARLAALELVVSAQAIDLRGASPLGAGTARAHAHIRELVPFVGSGQAWDNELGPLAGWVAAGAGQA